MRGIAGGEYVARKGREKQISRCAWDENCSSGSGIIATSLCGAGGKEGHDVSCPYIGRRAMDGRDPFTGTWRFCAEKSDAAGVRSWVQWIEVVGEEIRVREEVESAAGAKANVLIEARFDGKDYPVTGSSLADAIAYTRVDRHNIAGSREEKRGCDATRDDYGAGSRRRRAYADVCDFFGRARGDERGGGF